MKNSMCWWLLAAFDKIIEEKEDYREKMNWFSSKGERKKQLLLELPSGIDFYISQGK